MSSQGLKALNHCRYALTYHLVLVTKYRKKCLSTQIRSRLSEICERLTAQWGGVLREFGGEEDHLHLLIELPPSIAISRYVNNVKTVTSRLVRKDFQKELSTHYRKPTLWSRSYCVVSCGGASLEVLRKYIEEQGTS